MKLKDKITNRIKLESYALGSKDHKFIRKIRKEGLTYLEPEAMLDIRNQIQRIENEDIQGILIENGVALGGSAILMASCKSPERALHLYDTFEMIPPPDENDGEDAHKRYQIIKSGQSTGIKGDTYYGYKDDLRGFVQNKLESLVDKEHQKNVHYHQGFFEDTLNINQAVAFAHIDCDWFSSVTTCLERIVPHLSIGGALVIDDYHCYSGCTRAIDEYFQGKANFEKTMKQRLHILRTS